MKKIFTTLALLLALLLALTALTACAASKDGAVNDMGYSEAPSNSGSSSPGMNDSSVVIDPSTAEGKVGTKVIKTFDLNAETTDFDAATASLSELLAQFGGYVESASTYNQSLSASKNNRYNRSATYTLRIPAENAESFVGSLGTSLHLTSNRSYVEDISETYYSIEARLTELKVERDSLLDILDQTETKKDYNLWLTVKQRLSEVTQQIAVYQGQLNRYDSKVAYSTINLQVREVINYSTVSESNRFGSRLAASFKEGWIDFLEGLQSFIIWLAGALPVLLLLGSIGFGIFALIRGSIRRRRRRRQAQKHEE